MRGQQNIKTQKLDTKIQTAHFLRRHTKIALYHVAKIEFLLLRVERSVFPSSTGAKDFLLPQNVYTDSGAHSDSKSIVSQTGACRQSFGVPQQTLGMIE